MYPELTKFKEIKTHYDHQLDKLVKQQEVLEDKKEKLLDKYEVLLTKIDSNSDQESRDLLIEMKAELRKLAEAIGDIMEQISNVRNMKQDRLIEWKGSLKKGLVREVKAANTHLQLKKSEISQYRAELLLLVQQIKEISDYRQNILAEYLEVCHELLSEEEESQLRTTQESSIDINDILQTNIDKELQMVIETGSLPNWIDKYKQ